MGGGGGGALSGAASGALIGSVVPGVGTLVGAAVGGGLGLIQGMAGEDAARAQEGIARAQEAEQRRTQQLALQAAEPSAQEIQQIQNSIQMNEQDLARKERLLASSDPALIEAGQQALALLQGKEAGSLAPIKNQRAKERQALEARLRAQLGSGYANTTAGLQALSAFDEASTNALAGAQERSLGQLLGVAQNSSANFGMQSNITNSQNLATLLGNQSSRRVNAITGNRVDTAGSQFAGDLARSQQQMANMNNIMNLGVTYAGLSAGRTAGTAGTAGKVG